MINKRGIPQGLQGWSKSFDRTNVECLLSVKHTVGEQRCEDV